MSRLGRATLCPSIVLSPDSGGSPPSSSAMSVLVPPMSNVMRSRVPEQARRVPAPRDPAGRPRQDRARREAHGVRDRRDAAVRLHHQHAAGVAARPEPRREGAQVARERRADVRVHDGRADPLVLLDLRQHLGRHGQVRPGKPAARPRGGCRARAGDSGTRAGSRSRPRRPPRAPATGPRRRASCG